MSHLGTNRASLHPKRHRSGLGRSPDHTVHAEVIGKFLLNQLDFPNGCPSVLGYDLQVPVAAVFFLFFSVSSKSCLTPLRYHQLFPFPDIYAGGTSEKEGEVPFVPLKHTWLQGRLT